MRDFSSVTGLVGITATVIGFFVNCSPSDGAWVKPISQVLVSSLPEKITLSQGMRDPKPGRTEPVSGGAFVKAVSGLIIRATPGGKAIGKLAYRQRVGLTGAEQFAKGRTWSQISRGGWVAKDYLSFK